MTIQNNKEYKGYNGTLVITPTGVIIKRGIRGVLLGGGFLRGDKTIPYKSIVAVQLKKAGLTAGYIQLTLQGGSEAKGGLMQSTKDENSIHFYSPGNSKFEEAKRLIEDQISSVAGSVPVSSGLDEIEKLASLKEKGLITQEEFDAKKKKLLDI